MLMAYTNKGLCKAEVFRDGVSVHGPVSCNFQDIDLKSTPEYFGAVRKGLDDNIRNATNQIFFDPVDADLWAPRIGDYIMITNSTRKMADGGYTVEMVPNAGLGSEDDEIDYILVYVRQLSDKKAGDANVPDNSKVLRMGRVDY